MCFVMGLPTSRVPALVNDLPYDVPSPSQALKLWPGITLKNH
eukprot:CAMPEP_0170612574 /NCGR_PEP_ID=MMETSP0224-20130122/23795_1 /TAXON_ID=285029 /ORGANISM="Togula jolla, Strain CCCM 725" /LENGTH=41 /DNA_ID= /DNA_START= /DNA_END= /DNA_ORIENTATION=